MKATPPELMTPEETARWFRRSISWVRQQRDLLRLGGPAGQPLFHIRVCRAYVLGRYCRLAGAAIRRLQIQAMAAACGVPPQQVIERAALRHNDPEPDDEPQTDE